MRLRRAYLASSADWEEDDDDEDDDRPVRSPRRSTPSPHPTWF
jgi:hypothetical protein